MPVDGIPDRELHRFCLYCHRWHEPHEGQSMVLASGPLIGLRGAFALRTGDASALRFACFRCLRRRRVVRVTILSVFVLLVALVLLLERAGLFPG